MDLLCYRDNFLVHFQLLVSLILSCRAVFQQTSPSLYWCMGLFLLKCRTLHLPLLTWMRFMFIYFPGLFRSFEWKNMVYQPFLTLLFTNLMKVHLVPSSRSLVKKFILVVTGHHAADHRPLRPAIYLVFCLPHHLLFSSVFYMFVTKDVMVDSDKTLARWYKEHPLLSQLSQLFHTRLFNCSGRIFPS